MRTDSTPSRTAVGMYCSRVFKTLDCETVFVIDDTGAASNVVASNQNTIDQAISESAAPDKLSSRRIGDQLNTFRILLPINPPIALPTPIPMNSVAALNAVLVSEVEVDAPLTMSITERPSHAPKINPSNEKTLTNNPRRHPENRIKAAKAIKIRSR